MAKRVCPLKASPQFRPWFGYLRSHNSPPKWPKTHFLSLVGLSLIPPASQRSFSHWLPHTVPSAFQNLLPSLSVPECTRLTPTTGPLHVPLSLPRPPSRSPWLFLTFSDRSSPYYMCLSQSIKAIFHVAFAPDVMN